MMNPDARRWIAALQLSAHPEGGWFRETYRAGQLLPVGILGAGYDAERPLCTAIYYLLADDEVSLMHRLPGDELWHHYAGDGVTLHLFEHGDRRASEPAGAGIYRKISLGRNVTAGQQPQVLIPGGRWFGATVDRREGHDGRDRRDDSDDPAAVGRYALVGCTMAPGFTSADLELAQRDRLQTLFPAHADLITRLTRSGG